MPDETKIIIEIVPAANAERKIRAVLKKAMTDLEMSVSKASLKATRIDIQNRVKPNLTFGITQTAAKILRSQISTKVGTVSIKVKADTQNIKGDIQNKVGKIDLGVSAKSLGKLKSMFDKISPAKFKFDANTKAAAEKFVAKVNAHFARHPIAVPVRFTTKGIGQVRQDVKAEAGIAKQNAALDKNIQKTKKARTEVDKMDKSQQRAAKSAGTFAERLGFTTTRLAAYLLPATAIFRVSQSFDTARKSIVTINREINRLTQIMGGSASEAGQIADDVLTVAAKFAISGKDLLGITTLLAQSGQKFSGDNLLKAVDGIAKSDLGATFGNIQSTTTGLIAALNQFNLAGAETARVLDVVNTLSKNFAVQSSDIFEAVRRGGAAFAATGGTIEEFAALVAAMRELTQLSSSTIGTSISTLSIRSLGKDSLSFIENLVDESSNGQRSIRNMEGELKSLVDVLIEVGIASKNLSVEKKLEVATEIGKVRQGKVLIPLLTDAARGDDSVLLQALGKSKNAIGSLSKDAGIGLERIDKILESIGARFDQTFGELSQSQGIQNLVDQFASLAKGAASFVDIIGPILPSLIRLATIKFAIALPRLGKEFARGAPNFRLGGFRPGSAADAAGTGNAEVASTNANTTAINQLTTTIKSQTPGGAARTSNAAQRKTQFILPAASIDKSQLYRVSDRLARTRGERQGLATQRRALESEGSYSLATAGEKSAFVKRYVAKNVSRSTALGVQFGVPGAGSVQNIAQLRSTFTKKAGFAFQKEEERLIQKSNNARKKNIPALKKITNRLGILAKRHDQLSKAEVKLTNRLRVRATQLAATSGGGTATSTFGTRARAFGGAALSKTKSGIAAAGRGVVRIGPEIGFVIASAIGDSISASLGERLKDISKIDSEEKVREAIVANIDIRSTQSGITTASSLAGLGVAYAGGKIGAGIGTAIAPGIGTAIGAAIGGGIGLGSSFLFGSSKGEDKGEFTALDSLVQRSVGAKDALEYAQALTLLDEKQKEFGKTPKDTSLLDRKNLTFIQKGLASVDTLGIGEKGVSRSKLVSEAVKAAVAANPDLSKDQQKILSEDFRRTITDEETFQTLVKNTIAVQKFTEQLNLSRDSFASLKAELIESIKRTTETNVIASSVASNRARSIDTTLGQSAFTVDTGAAAAFALTIQRQIIRSPKQDVDIFGANRQESSLIKDAILLDEVILRASRGLQRQLGNTSEFSIVDKNLTAPQLKIAFDKIIQDESLSDNLSIASRSKFNDALTGISQRILADKDAFRKDPQGVVQKATGDNLTGLALTTKLVKSELEKLSIVINASNKEYQTQIQFQKTQTSLDKRAIAIMTQHIERSRSLGSTRQNILGSIGQQAGTATGIGLRISGLASQIDSLIRNPIRTSDSFENIEARAQLENELRLAQSALTNEMNKTTSVMALLQKQFSLLNNEVNLQVKSVQAQSTASFKDLTLSKIAVEQLRSITSGQAGSLKGGARGVLNLSEEKLRQLNNQFSGLANTPLLIQTLQRAQLQGTSTIDGTEVSDIISSVKFLAGDISGILRAKTSQDKLRDTGKAIGGLARTELDALNKIHTASKESIQIFREIKESIASVFNKAQTQELADAIGESVAKALSSIQPQTTGGSGSSSSDIKMDLNITGFESIGKGKASKLIVASILNQLASKLNGNAQERALAEKFLSIARELEGNETESKPDHPFTQGMRY